MPSYDFSTLSPSDFEILSRDLLQRHFRLNFESFRTGRDRGIDLRYSRPKGGDLWIVQAKHYIRSGFSKLKAVLAESESTKLARLRPSRYIITTSVSLTPERKDELHQLLTPYCGSSGDIFGQEDLNNLLAQFPDVEQSTFKLWLPSTAVLQRLLHNGVFTRSALELEDIKRHLSLFVPTEAIRRALQILESTGFCMLTGIPGIGKTTTARLLVAHHVHNGWHGVYLSGHTQDAFAVFAPSTKQIFFYDDFLGLTSLRERLPKNEDKELYDLIRACRRHPETKRLILTTREYLYEQAVNQSEVLSKRAAIETAKSTVELKDYTDKIRAQILVNHLYFFGIDPDACSTLVTSGVARKTIDHANYNPRIVETVCERWLDDPVDGGQFGQRFLEMLDTPEEIWEHAYQNQLSEDARYFLLVFAMHESSVSIDGLKHHFAIYLSQVKRSLIGFESTFASCLKELEGTFLMVHRGEEFHYVDYHNPAIKDFTDAALIRDCYALNIALRTFTYESVLLFVAGLLTEHHRESVIACAFLGAIERADWKTRFRVSRNSVRPTLQNPMPRERSLANWLRNASKLKDRNVMVEVLKKVDQFFEELDCRHVVIEFAVDLYGSYVTAAFFAHYENVFESKRLREALLAGCQGPDDFTALSRLLADDHPDDVEMLRLREKFYNEYGAWLDTQVQDANSSEQIDDAIYSVTATAERLGINGNDLDLGEAEQHRDHLLAREEQEAERQIEERKMGMWEERIEGREVDDILDSLRG